MSEVTLRPAAEADVPAIYRMILEMADYNKALYEEAGKRFDPDSLRVTEADLRRDGFGPAPRFECLIAETATGPVGFEGTPTAGVCRFEDLAVPDGAVSARVWFNWTTEADLDGLGLVLRDEDECGGGGCELARADGDPVVLDITKEVRGEARWEDLSLTVDGTSLMPEWSLQIGFYATPVPG